MSSLLLHGNISPSVTEQQATFTPEDAPAAEQLSLSQFCLHVAEPSHYSRIKGNACSSVQHKKQGM